MPVATIQWAGPVRTIHSQPPILADLILTCATGRYRHLQHCTQRKWDIAPMNTKKRSRGISPGCWSKAKRVLQDLGPGKDQKPFAVVEGYRADELVISIRGAKPGPEETTTTDRSTQTTDNTGDTAVEVKTRDASLSLAGTTWTGNNPEAGEYTIEFLQEGQIHYIINVLQNGVTSPRTVKGSWKQSGNSIQIVIGNSYSVLQGTIDGSMMKGEGSNQEGATWKWTLFKKE